MYVSASYQKYIPLVVVSSQRDCQQSVVDALLLFCFLLKGFNSSQVGSLAGAAHLLHANAGVLRVTPQEQKSCLAYKGKSYLDQFIQYMN